jgi:hypothetical protein
MGYTLPKEGFTKMRNAVWGAALAVLLVPSCFAQNGRPKCDGDYAIVRVSTIKPGAMQGFMAAVAAHKAWYRSHGFNDDIIVASRVITTDPTTKAMKYSDTEVITYHINPASGSQTQPKRDAAWDAYVKQYRDTSDIKSEYFSCMPKLVP